MRLVEQTTKEGSESARKMIGIDDVLLEGFDSLVEQYQYAPLTMLDDSNSESLWKGGVRIYRLRGTRGSPNLEDEGGGEEDSLKESCWADAKAPEWS